MASSLNQHALRTSELILSILKSKGEESNLSDPLVLETTVNSTCELLLFRQDGSSYNDLVGYINRCLGTSSTRIAGLALLGPLVSQASAQQFQQHCLSWLHLLLQIIQPHTQLSQLKLCSSLVNQVLSKASSYPDVSRELASKMIQPLVEKALQIKDERVLYGLEVLLTCMKFFPGPCGAMRNQLVNHLIAIIGNSKSDHVAETAGNCFALLPSIGGGGVGGVLYKEAWSFYMKKLLNTLKDLFSKLYKDHDSAFENQVEGSDIIPLPQPTSDEPQQTFTLAEQAQRMLHIMRSMLENTFPATVIIPHRDILAMICNILAVTGSSLTLNGSTQSCYLLMVLTGIHEASLQLLNAFILRCSNHLLPHGKVINQLLLQLLNWTALCDADAKVNSFKFRGIKCQVYQTYRTWLNGVGASAYMGENAAKLIAHIMNDAHLQENPQQESNSKEPKQDPCGPRKKKQKKHHQWKVEPVGSSKHDSNKQVEHLYVTVLAVLRTLFFTCGSRLKWTLHRDTHLAVTRALLQCQTGLGLASSVYQSAVCRKELYHVLLASVLVSSPSWSVPLNSCICIFSQGRLDCSFQVKEFCTEAITVCENLIHPRMPQIPIVRIPEEETEANLSSHLPSLWFPVKGHVNVNPVTESEISPNLDQMDVISEFVPEDKLLHSDITTGGNFKENQSQRMEMFNVGELNQTEEKGEYGHDGDHPEKHEDIEQFDDIAIDTEEDNTDQGEETLGSDGESGDVSEVEKVTSENNILLEEGGVEKSGGRIKTLTCDNQTQNNKGSIDEMLASFSTEGPDIEA